MTSWSAQINSLHETRGADTSWSRGALVTANSSANVKGGWVDLGSATSFDYQSMWVAMANAGAGAADFVVDIGLSDGTNRWIIMPNLRLPGMAGAWTGGTIVQLPLYIPKGAQISVRCAASTGSRTCHVQVTGCTIGMGGAPGFAYAIQSYTVGSSRGQDLDPATINTKSSWVQLGSSALPNDIGAALFCVGPAAQVTRTVQRAYLLDIGRGSSGNESVWLPDIQIVQAIDDQRPLPSYIGPLPVAINDGGRLFARCQTTEVTSTERKIDIAAWGFVP